MEPVDSPRDITKRSSEPLIISNSTLLDCCMCFQPLSIPVFQCDNGHIVCSTCCPKLRNKCPKCSLPISSKRCKAVENPLLSIAMSCPNTKYGCTEKISYLGNRKHEEECIHEPCYCPLSGCDFVASSKVLSNHLIHKHRDSLIIFYYDDSFVVTLKSNDETIVLLAKEDGKLFILNNSTMNLGIAVNICCIGPKSFEFDHHYDILARSHKSTLKLQSVATNVQRFTLGTLSLGFLMIPIDSSKSLKLYVCIKSPIKPRMMHIFIKMLDNRLLPLEVKSSNTIGDVKQKIFEKKGIPYNDQRLIFSFKRLQDSGQTLADHNIKENSTIYLVLRVIGD
ncbi:unnamed protein product [Trifolium pratense]|uniref:Uncharacterized protein n=1 Tax=Trifolium pratense TaxID=57577 RepID=A0ACB0KAY4_TRIPR|nr:unnamed protein product [Trifolium pratense]